MILIETTITLFSPAKVNLFLRVVGKRNDGYHDLASLFQAIDFGDTIRLSLATEDQFACDDSSIPRDGNNLVLKAVSLFRRKTGLHTPLDIHLMKRVPSCSGLGGGSSNAATTLWGINALHGSPASEKELQRWSAEIGSDIPFFFSYGTAYCTGRGEIVQNIPALRRPTSIVLHQSTLRISTAEVFKCLKLDKCSIDDPVHLLESFLQGEPIFYNDLEKVACHFSPTLAVTKKKIREQGFDPVCMTGSGSAFFSPPDPENLNHEEVPKIRFIHRKCGEWYSQRS